MAYLLYKYIKKRRAASAQQQKTSEHELKLNDDNQSPFQITEDSERIVDSDQGPKTSEARVEEESIAKEAKRAARIYRWRLIAGLFLPFSVQALETTIVAGALPFIASDFNQLSQLNWIVSAFNLCSATFIPFWGQMADVFGRYAALQSALVIMIIGSSLSSGAPVTAFPMLLVGRGLQGMGCAGLNIIVRTVLSDKVSLKENAKNNTIFTLVAGVSYGVGPTIGGYLTQVTWRWCFILFVPIGVVGLILSHFVLRPVLLGPQKISRTDGVDEADVPQTVLSRFLTIDFGGQFLFLFGMGLLVLALTWGGSYYPWKSAKVLAPLVVGGVLIAFFLIWEYFMMPGNSLANQYPYRKPMIPLSLLFSRNVGIIIYINFITGMAMYAVFYFADLYFTLVLQYSSGKAGTNIVYYLPGLGFGAYAAIFLCNVYPKQTWPPLFIGTIIEPLGITLLAVALSSKNVNLIYGMLALTGVGTGIRFMPGTLHGVGYFPHKIASIVSLMLLSVSLGGAFSLTIMLNIFNNKMREDGLSFAGSGNSFNAIGDLSPEKQESLRDKAKSSISLAYFAISAFCWLGCVFMMGLGNVDIGKDRGEGEERSNVTKGTYLGSIFRRKEGVEGREIRMKRRR